MKFKFIIMAIPALVGAAVFQGDLTGLIQRGAKLEKLAEGFKFTEGPSVDSEGNIFFTDQPNDRIMEWSTDDRLTTFMQPSGRSNGTSFDKDNNLWSCADEKNELWIIRSDKSVTRIPSMYEGKLLNGPNDLWTDSKGGVYFTDPFYKRTWWNHQDQPQDIEAVYYLNPDHRKITRVISDLTKPNGIVGTPDGRKLFVADIGANKTWSYTINKDASLSDKKLFCELGSDGMTIDSKGNIYLTGNGVTVFNADGKQIGNIPVPEKWTANVCFGGKDLKYLYITASTGLYRMKMNVKGTRG